MPSRSQRGGGRLPRVASLLLCTLPFFTSCAAAMQSWREAHCHYDGAYKLGMNDARQGKEMSQAIAMHCPAQGKADAERGYREGSSGGASSHLVLAAPHSSNWQCKEAYGKRACGYGCIAGYGQVACASSPDQSCVQAYGQLRCGHNCRSSFGEIACD